MIHPYLENALLYTVGQEFFEKMLKEPTLTFQHGVLRAFQAMLKNDPEGYARCMWVMSCPGEIRMLPFEAYKISRYVFAELYGKAADGKSTQFLSTKVTGLPRDLLYDAAQKKVTIIASASGCSIQASVSYKAVRSATLLSFGAKEPRKERAVYAAPAPDSVKYFTSEVGLLQKLHNVPGLVRLHTVVGAGANAHMVLEAFEHTLMYMIQNRAAYTDVQRLEVAVDLTRALSHLHAQKVLHNDLNENNTVFRKLPDGTVQAALIDLSLACYAGQGKRASYFNRPGFYNALWNTAPELIHVIVTDDSPAAEDLYKAEVFALGCVLWHLFDDKSEYVPWKDTIEKYYQTTLPEAHAKLTAIEIPSKQRVYVQEVRDLLDHFVLKPYREIMEETAPACRTPKELLRAALCAMLLPTPQKRCSAQDAYGTFCALLEKEKAKAAAGAGAGSATKPSDGSAAAAASADWKSAVEVVVTTLSDLKVETK